MQLTPDMRGFITDEHLDQAEGEFPGISRFYGQCERKPSTFLELVTRYLRFTAFIADGAALASN
jgi:hypothetical protein